MSNEFSATAAPVFDASELDGYRFDDLRIGMTAVYAKTITESDINLFCAISGDTNPLHLDHEYARTTMFGGPIAHGMLSASLISTVIGTKLPGPGCVYVSQNCRFKAPVRAGDTVRARVTITGLVPERRRVGLKTVCTVGDTVVVDGDAVVMVPDG
ncbi:MAG: MaoC family dehydratase [Proteobacteria bacterium]|nr:MaoC family dehydratase [Pseudomonadota bacterium]